MGASTHPAPSCCQQASGCLLTSPSWTFALISNSVTVHDVHQMSVCVWDGLRRVIARCEQSDMPQYGWQAGSWSWVRQTGLDKRIGAFHHWEEEAEVTIRRSFAYSVPIPTSYQLWAIGPTNSNPLYSLPLCNPCAKKGGINGQRIRF